MLKMLNKKLQIMLIMLTMLSMLTIQTVLTIVALLIMLKTSVAQKPSTIFLQKALWCSEF